MNHLLRYDIDSIRGDDMTQEKNIEDINVWTEERLNCETTDYINSLIDVTNIETPEGYKLLLDRHGQQFLMLAPKQMPRYEY